MRTLRFIVDGQMIRPDPECDFDNLAPGSEGYLAAEFAFSREWDGLTKVAAFYSRLGQEYKPQPLNDGKSCVIPSEALAKRIFKVQVKGLKRGLKLCTNRLTVEQKGGKV